MHYHNITKDDMKNGEGLRVVLWVSGCGHYCPGCQNPVTWDPNDGILFDEKAKEEIFEELKKPYIKGITFSGGDPLHVSNTHKILDLAEEIKQKFPTKDIWLYTGYTWECIRIIDRIKYIDVVVDGPFKKELADTTYPWAGSTNQRVIDVKKSLESASVMLYHTR